MVWAPKRKAFAFRDRHCHRCGMDASGVADVGVLGLGIIGSIWARHFHEAGRLAGAWNRSPKPEESGWMDEAGYVVEASRIVFIVVADPPAVEGLLNRIGPKLTPEHVIVQSSTIDPASSERFHRRVAETGAQYIEAPFTGSKPAAESRSLVFYLGGDERLIHSLDTTLALIAGTRLQIGTQAQAASLKLAMNLQLAIMAEAMCESLHFARRAGIDDDTYFAAMRINASWSGLAALKEPKLRLRDYSPQFSVKHMHKDVRLALASMKGTDLLPLTAAVKGRLNQAEKAGFADLDFVALARLLEESHEQRV
jgi:3-hydroxyisobutyrate dehydrogenase-like beta-hydroxyacid dehydrogenase